MKTISLCSRDEGCCPSIKEDKKAGITYIVDGDQKIAFTQVQLKELCEYLCSKKMGCCDCKSCQA